MRFSHNQRSKMISCAIMKGPGRIASHHAQHRRVPLLYELFTFSCVSVIHTNNVFMKQ